MTEGGAPDRTGFNGLPSDETQTEIFPVVGEPPPPPRGASPGGGGASPAGGGAPWTEPEPALSDDRRQGGSYTEWNGRHGTGDGGVSVANKSRKLARSLEGHLRAESPWMLGSAALLLALLAYWADSILLAFQHAPGMTGQDRVLQLLTPGSFGWAAGVLLAVALHCAGRHFELAPSEPGPLHSRLPGFLLAAAIAALVAAALDVLVELANFGHGIDRALAGLLGYLGVIGLAGATAWWAHRESQATRSM
jgi:hypothetical protein